MKKLNDSLHQIIHKPWGFEYLFYQNSEVAIWKLHISEGCQTSLHCHPNKKTGLIVLSGRGELSFFNDTTELNPMSRHIIREGLFHSTRAIGGQLVMLEVEAPPVKEDIVRFDDVYGRKYKGIEETKAISLLDHRYPLLSELGFVEVGDYNIRIDEYITADAEATIAVIRGGVYADEDLIVGPGDVGSMSSLIRLCERFGRPKSIGLMTCVARP